MSMKLKNIMTSFAIFLWAGWATVYAQNCNNAQHTGEGTFYGGVAGSAGGNCGIPVAADDFNHCALNNQDYNTSQACGACLEVKSASGKSIIVKVVDRCPECAPGDVDLTRQAFAKIEDPTKGRIPITWRFVPCPVNNTTIKVNFKSGSSQFWTAIQLRNIRHAVTKLEYKKDDAWVNIPRENFNFFIETAGIASPMTLRATSILNEQLIFENININTSNDYDTNQQFTTPDDCLDQVTSIAENKPIGLYSNNQGIYSKNHITDWKLFNHMGRLIKQGKRTQTIDTQNLRTGLYILVYDRYRIKYLKR
ncbi:hypothetical protein BKI52_24340 [marine bacterium AO1-C]|nr:hypothetical protein BKI52_24340 [marine bacterium AO1-C]